MGLKRNLTVPGRFEYLAAIADFIAAAGREAGFAQDTIFHVQMAVDEACSNIIEHAYRGQGRGKIMLTSECTKKGEWVLTIQDTGRPFDPRAVPKPNLNVKLDDIKTGGLGLYFMHQLMDKVEFSFGKRGNRLRMIKREV
jgi:anti-sigma regulatory factor (Ser/Thr protein kinase)